MIIDKALLKSGIASRQDLNTDQMNQIIQFLDDKQRLFLQQQNAFRSKEYKWGLDALHWWSRIWEYPYMFSNIRSLLESLPLNQANVLDFGSGVTFFSFLISELGCQLTCVDNDPICIDDINKAIKYFNRTKTMKAVLAEDYTIPLESKSYDIIYSVSVIEHIPEFEKTVYELHRLLKKDGYLILTFDVCLKGNAAISKERYDQLIRVLMEKFDIFQPEKTIHPLEVLTSENSPYPYLIKNSIKSLLYNLKRSVQSIARSEQPRNYFVKDLLAVQGMVLKAK